MRIKRKGIFIGLFSMLLLCGLALLFLFVPTDKTTTASAAETPKYAMTFNYSGTRKESTHNDPYNGVTTSLSLGTASYFETFTFGLSIYGSSASGSGTLAYGGTVKSDQVTITAETNTFYKNLGSYNLIKKVQLYDAEGQYQVDYTAPQASDTYSTTLFSGKLADGLYTLTVTWETLSRPNTYAGETCTTNITTAFTIQSNPCADGHKYRTSVTPATCTESGRTQYSCSRCGDYYEKEIPALGHSYSSTKMPATCTSGGYTTYRCTRCNHTYTGDQTSALGHNYSSKTTDATCTAGGYTTHQCSRCGSSYVDNRTAALGHSYDVETVTTCTGERLTYTCSRCRYSYTETTNENGSGHSFTTKTTAATCMDDGITIYTCSKCGYSYQDVVALALGHNYTASVVSPTCTAGGYTLFSCSRCGNEYRSGETQASGHNYIEKTYPATCTEGSYTLHECSRCGDNYKDNVSQPLGHNFTTSEEPPTCTEGGKTTLMCQICGYETYEADGSLPKGHSYSNVIIRFPTCTEEGIRKCICEDCGDSYETSIAPLGHNYAITDATSSGGNTRRTYTCSTCGDSYTQELGKQYEQVTNYVEYLFEQYAPYMYWVLLATESVTKGKLK